MSLLVRTEDDYEDLLGLWADLEAGLGLLLTHPRQAQEFAVRVQQYDRWMQDLMRHDADVGLYLLFQLASSSPVGYSASHALVCAVLCHLLAAELGWPAAQRNSLVRAAMTMNLAMTRLQDELAGQKTRPSAQQQEAIAQHPAIGAQWLAQLGVQDALWLHTVAEHHASPATAPHTPEELLPHALQMVDRYAALISPRENREGRSASESAQSLLHEPRFQASTVAQALVRVVGATPPGTYVRLNGDEVAVVLRRGPQAERPEVAIVLDARGQRLRPPTLHRTAQGEPRIRTALAATAVQENLHHHLILQMGQR
jgi:hypothetical protein